MKAWTRATIATYCGACGAHVPAGELLIAWHVRGVSRPLWRCVVCAEAGDAPADVPAPQRPQWFRTDLQQIRTAATAHPIDVKSRAAGEREPGDDD